MGRAKKNDSEVDFTDNGKFKDDPPVPGQGHNIKEMNEAIAAAEEEYNRLNDEIQARHDKKKEVFANLKATYGLTRKNLERNFKYKQMDPEKREKQDEEDAIIREALFSVQPDMLGGPDVPLAGKDAAAEQSATVQ